MHLLFICDAVTLYDWTLYGKEKQKPPEIQVDQKLPLLQGIHQRNNSPWRSESIVATAINNKFLDILEISIFVIFL